MKSTSIAAIAFVCCMTAMLARPDSARAQDEDQFNPQSSTKAAKMIRNWTSKSDKNIIFDPYWFVFIEDGASWSMGQYRNGKMNFTSCLSNHLLVGGGYNFNPWIGTRLTLSYGQGRAIVQTTSSDFSYAYQLLTPAVDVIVNASNLFGGYRHDRAVDVYGYIGLGCHIAFDNTNNDLVIPYLDKMWKAPSGALMGRAGALMKIRLTNKVGVLADFNVDCAPDYLNSKTDPWWNNPSNPGGWDSRLNLLVGVSYRIDSNYKALSQVLATTSASTALAFNMLRQVDSTVYDASKVIADARSAAACAVAACDNATDAAAYAERIGEIVNSDAIRGLVAETRLAATVATTESGVSITDANKTQLAVDEANAASQATREAAMASNKILIGTKFNKAISEAAGKNVDLAMAAEQTAVGLLNAATDATIASTAVTIGAADKANELAERCRALALDLYQAYAVAHHLNADGKFEIDVFFDLNSSYFNKHGWEAVQIIAQWLKENPDENVMLIGYASAESGGDSYNMWLSEKRVNHVAEWLQVLGIPASRFKTDFRGEREQPFEFNDDNRVVTCRQQYEK